jgi:CBS domain-containing protein
MLKSVDLQHYMQPDPETVAPGDSLFKAMDIILREGISGLCVVDGERRLLGVLSEMDCLQTILSCTYNDVCNLGTVAEYMTTDVDVVQRHADVVNVAELMLRNSRRRMPVVDNGILVGQVTCRRLLRAVREFNQSDA